MIKDITKNLITLHIDEKYYDVFQYTIDGELQNKVYISIFEDTKIKILKTYTMNDTLMYLTTNGFDYILNNCKTYNDLTNTMSKYFDLYKDDK